MLFKQYGRHAFFLGVMIEGSVDLNWLLSSTQKNLLPTPWFTTSIFPGACPLLCVTSQKPVKGGRLDNSIFNEAEFSPLASSICIGLDLSAVSAGSGSLCAALGFDGGSDYPVTVITTWMHCGP